METSLCTSDVAILVAMAAVLAAVTSLVLARQRTERWVARSGLHRGAWLAFAVAAAAAGVAMAWSCPTGTAGRCPAPLTGTGYICPSPPPSCGWSGTCKTVKGTMPWHSDCECQCQ